MSRDINFYKYLLALNYFPAFGPVSLRKIWNRFSSPREIWKAKSESLIKAGIKRETALSFIEARKKINPDLAWEKLKKENIQIISFKDEEYPSWLKEIYAPPLALYYKGNIKLLKSDSLAIVGSRKCTSYGQKSLEVIGKKLLNNYQINIVSGLALGIDAKAHQVALEQNEKTIAVLGSGLNQKNIYPASNQSLAQKIIKQNGLLLSEFPPGVPALKHHFPQRNRIISGISKGVWIVEAAKRSGALITARYALEQNREVMALPGNIFSSASQGANQLIKQGAYLIDSEEEIGKTLDLTKKEKSAINNKQAEINLSEKEKKILSQISKEPCHINQISRQNNLNISEVNSLLSSMELKGLIYNLGENKYIKN